MNETLLTKKMKIALLDTFCPNESKGIYPAYEVTLGDYYGDERVDFLTMNSRQQFKCYEIKSSLSDLKSNAKLSFVGDYNYFVMPEELYKNVNTKDFLANYFVAGIGLYLFHPETNRLSLERRAKQKTVHLWKRTELTCCMVRSLSKLTKLIKRC